MHTQICKIALAQAYAIVHICAKMPTEVTMTISAEMAEIEAQLAASGRTVKALCAQAGVNQSTWTRWKAGLNEPNMATWDKVRDAFTAMTAASDLQQGAA